MAVPFTYVKLAKTGESWTIATTLDSAAPGKKANMMCTSTTGLLTAGENSLDPVERSYSDGAVLAPKPRFIGRNFTLDIAFYGGGANVNINTNYKNFQTFIKSSNLTFTTDFPHSLTVQFQNDDLITEDWKGNLVVVRLYFKAAEA